MKLPIAVAAKDPPKASILPEVNSFADDPPQPSNLPVNYEQPKKPVEEPEPVVLPISETAS
jgi:hypothetical protein